MITSLRMQELCLTVQLMPIQPPYCHCGIMMARMITEQVPRLPQDCISLFQFDFKANTRACSSSVWPNSMIQNISSHQTLSPSTVKVKIVTFMPSFNFQKHCWSFFPRNLILISIFQSSKLEGESQNVCKTTQDISSLKLKNAKKF